MKRESPETWFAVFTAVIVIVGVCLSGVSVWAIIELVKWVTSK